MSQRYNYLVNKFKKKLESACFKTKRLTKDCKNKEEIIKTLSKNLWDLDPTPKKIRAEVIFRWYSENPFKEEDFYKITENLNLYELYKKHCPEKDLSKFKTYHDFFTMMIPVLDKISSEEISPLSNNEKDRLIKQKAYNESEIVENTDDYILVIPKTKEAAQYFGRGTQWCTSGQNGNQFNYYSIMGNLFILIEKKTEKNENPKKYQFHFETQQFMDVHDRPVRFKFNQSFKRYTYEKTTVKLKSFLSFFQKLENRDFNQNKIWTNLSEQELYDIISYNKKSSRNFSLQNLSKKILLKILETENILNSFQKDPIPQHMLTDDVIDALKIHNKNYIVNHLWNHPVYQDTAKKLLEENKDLFDFVPENFLTEDLILNHVEESFSRILPEHLLTEKVINALIKNKPDYFIKNYLFFYAKNPDLTNKILDLTEKKFHYQRLIPLIEILQSMTSLFSREILEAHIMAISKVKSKNLKNFKYSDKMIESLKKTKEGQTYLNLIQKHYPIEYTKTPILENFLEFSNGRCSKEYKNFLLKNPNLLVYVPQNIKTLDFLNDFAEITKISQQDIDAVRYITKDKVNDYKQNIKKYQKDLDFYDTPESLKNLAEKLYQIRKLKSTDYQPISENIVNFDLLQDFMPLLCKNILEILQNNISSDNKKIIEDVIDLTPFFKTPNFDNIKDPYNISMIDAITKITEVCLLYTHAGHYKNAYEIFKIYNQKSWYPLQYIKKLFSLEERKKNISFPKKAKELYALHEKIIENSKKSYTSKNIIIDSETRSITLKEN